MRQCGSDAESTELENGLRLCKTLCIRSLIAPKSSTFQDRFTISSHRSHPDDSSGPLCLSSWSIVNVGHTQRSLSLKLIFKGSY